MNDGMKDANDTYYAAVTVKACGIFCVLNIRFRSDNLSLGRNFIGIAIEGESAEAEDGQIQSFSIH